MRSITCTLQFHSTHTARSGETTTGISCRQVCRCCASGIECVEATDTLPPTDTKSPGTAEQAGRTSRTQPALCSCVCQTCVHGNGDVASHECSQQRPATAACPEQIQAELGSYSPGLPSRVSF